MLEVIINNSFNIVLFFQVIINFNMKLYIKKNKNQRTKPYLHYLYHPYPVGWLIRSSYPKQNQNLLTRIPNILHYRISSLWKCCLSNLFCLYYFVLLFALIILTKQMDHKYITTDKYYILLLLYKYLPRVVNMKTSFLGFFLSFIKGLNMFLIP